MRNIARAKKKTRVTALPLYIITTLTIAFCLSLNLSISLPVVYHSRSVFPPRNLSVSGDAGGTRRRLGSAVCLRIPHLSSTLLPPEPVSAQLIMLLCLFHFHVFSWSVTIITLIIFLVYKSI